MQKFEFKGLLCPVFTPFAQDKKSVNYDVIDRYCQYLKSKNVQGVFVNGVTGEGTCLRIDERKRLAEEWFKVCRKYSLTMTLCIGGCDIVDVYYLCEHAEKLGVDSIVLMPDLFYKPKIEEDLVEYFKNVCKYCPTRPVYYYHIPEYTYVKLNMVRFYELIQKSCPNFCGIFYRYGEIEVAYALWKNGCHLIMCNDTLLPGLKSLGFDAFCLISLNLWPEKVMETYGYTCQWKLREAYEVHIKLCDCIKEICNNHLKYCDWVEAFKSKFGKVVDFNVGGLRKPHCTWWYNKN
ncbi:N-acetylneuraminate lyase B-like [Sitodiplosis mosellana]|uniref:N-acetylneuraminate lyase B-like n=1 Tax=Sitodiplosis mosellana TaxID=263140 RepID=UPI002443B6AF|nr:N-acetylneuraminate lyase B-like [Sitodiplosis mosellana]